MIVFVYKSRIAVVQPPSNESLNLENESCQQPAIFLLKSVVSTGVYRWKHLIGSCAITCDHCHGFLRVLVDLSAEIIAPCQ